MGKDLKGKELGVGISQRKDGLYTARFVSRTGKRKQKYFHKLQECRKWIADAQFEDEHGDINASGDMTVDAWFEYWIENIKSASVKKSTRSRYGEIYEQHIKPYIGDMILCDIKPLHCQNIFNIMVNSGYKNSSIGLTYTVIRGLFDDAVENVLINKSPVTRSVQCTQGKAPETKTAMTVDEQKRFLSLAQKSSYYYQYAFVLQTGIRVGELAGLRWSDIDFEKKICRISRTMNQIKGEWVVGTPKSKAGKREIPLTDEAVDILNKVKGDKKRIPVTQIQYHDTIFFSRNGRPIDDSAYNAALRKICDRAVMPHISMHTLRHTFATRCIEAGMQPKTLQEILGHSTISMSMNVYVHVMEDTKIKEMQSVQPALKVI